MLSMGLLPYTIRLLTTIEKSCPFIKIRSTNMRLQLSICDVAYEADLTLPIDISIPLVHQAAGPKCFAAPEVDISPVVVDDWVGSTAAGSPVNFYNVKLNPHGNGTHTECVGHITKEPLYLSEVLQQSMCTAQLATVNPTALANGDKVITDELLKAVPFAEGVAALIIRTYPNDKSKLTRDYTGTNPPYLTKEAVQYIVAAGIQHLLLDLPSIDREVDGGQLVGHKTFWGYPATIDRKKTVTEMIYVNNSVPDGLYLCDIQTINIELDASPSRPVLYKLTASEA